MLWGLACGCGAGIGQGCLFPGAASACRPASLGYEGCPGLSAGRKVRGGFRVCLRGNPHRVLAPGGILGSHGGPYAWGAPNLFGPWSPVSRGVSLVARGPRDGPDVVSLHGYMDAEGRASSP